MHGKETENTLGEANPIRYRGYYFDTETGYYYLQSRYYDSSICRFINADTYKYAKLQKMILPDIIYLLIVAMIQLIIPIQLDIL